MVYTPGVFRGWKTTMQANRKSRLLADTQCDIRFDDLSCALYATDASIYQIRPFGVAFPKDAKEVSALVRASAAESLPLIPRGAGTGLAGGAIGQGLVMDLSLHHRAITDLNIDARTVRVGAGVVLDDLNTFLRPHGLAFGPDVATSSRATFGGMIGNNSSGARCPLYGTTIDHIRSTELVLPDGRIVDTGPDSPAVRELLARIMRRVEMQSPRIRERFHDRINKRWTGYGLDRLLRAPNDFTRLVGASEGTLGTIVSAELNLVPLPRAKALGLVFFASVTEAMQATVELMDLKPAAIEHIDDVLFNQTRGQLPFKAARALMALDELPCKSILIVEFYEENADAVEAKLALLDQKRIGLRKLMCRKDADINHVWNMRKAGLSLLSGCKGRAKPVTGIEDAAVPVENLPGFVQGLYDIFKPLGLDGSFYGHAASGLLHVRPVIDLHTLDGLKLFRQVAEEFSALTRKYEGSLSAEHGVGICRSEFMLEQVGPDLLGLMREIKHIVDPKNVMNPGKIFPEPRYRIDTNLRQAPDRPININFEPVLAFAARDESFVGNLEQCNGCGGCRKSVPTMCPTFVATGEDLMSTRGRANTIRAVLEGRVDQSSPALNAPALHEALSSCLSCKACTTECPSNVNMALLKAELLHAAHRAHGTPLAARLVSRVDLLGRMGSLFPNLSNRVLAANAMRRVLEWTVGFARQRPLPPYAPQRFDTWFAKTHRAPDTAPRGRVVLWDDCFVRHNEPGIGQAAVRVLEAAGFEVVLPTDRACCGRPAFSTGCLDTAKAMGQRNLDRFGFGDETIVFLEPSCYSMFKEDYIELKLEGAQAMAKKVMLFEHFMEELLAREPEALAFGPGPGHAAIHAHCHTKALTGTAPLVQLARRVPGSEITLLNTGCCGMAGSFGAMKSKYELSLKVAEPLRSQVDALPEDATVIASGTSCRHQLEHTTGRHALHMAEYLSAALALPMPTTQNH